MSDGTTVKVTLDDFRAEDAAAVLDWVRSADVALGWAEVPFLRVGPDLLEAWHSQPGVVPCVGRSGGELCAYGQILEDHQSHEAEVARVIVAPDRRRLGIGRTFVLLLAREARRRGFDTLVARTVRANRVAFDLYRSAGFVRMPREDEVALNLDQSQDYVWLEHVRPRH